MADKTLKEFLNVRLLKSKKLAFKKKAAQNDTTSSKVTQEFVDAYLEDRVVIRPTSKK